MGERAVGANGAGATIGADVPGDDPLGQAAGPPTPWRIVLALAATQMIGWGTTYYLPAILARPIGADTGLSPEFVFGGVTIMVLVSAGIAPWAGRRLEREGARGPMAAGSALTALGLGLLGLATGPISYALAWTLLGLAAPFALTQAASTALVQVAPDRARRAIALLMLFSGLSSTASWPLLSWLDGAVGWRASLALFAGVHLLVCAPLHLAALPRGRRFPGDHRGATSAPERGAPPPAPVRGAFSLLALALALAGFVSWGLPLHVVAMLAEDGYAEGAAVALGSLIGPAQVLARLFDLLGAERLDILTVGLAAAFILPFALLVGLLAPASGVAAGAFCLGYGLAAGAMTIVRAVAPLRLFGREAYAVMIGRLAVPQNVAFAMAPAIFAAVRERAGAAGLLVLAAMVAAGAFAALALLVRRVRAAEADRRD